jgi:hypothetical protein
MGHTVTAARGRASGHQHPQYVVAALRGWLKPENRCLMPFNCIAEIIA